MPQDRRLSGYVYLTLAMITVGSAVIASKILAATLPPFTATALRFAIAIVPFLILVRVTNTPLPRMPASDWRLLILQALAGAIGYTALLMAGLRTTSAGDAAIILGLLPLVAALFAVVILKERPGRVLWIALAAAVAGVLIATGTGGAGGGSWLGRALVFGAVACEALFALLNRKMTTRLRPLMLSTLTSAFGFALSGVAALFESPWSLHYEARALAAVAYYALVPTVVGFYLWYEGSTRVKAVEASLFTAVAPVAAIVLAGVVLGEPVTRQAVVGIAVVIGAVLFFGLHAGRARADALEPLPEVVE